MYIISGAVIRLYIIHIFAFFAVWLGTYFPGADLLLSLIYIFSISFEIRLLRFLPNGIKAFIGLMWQGLPAILSTISVAGLSFFDISNYAFFILEFLYTPLIPLLSLITPNLPLSRPLYYYLLLVMPIMMSLHYYLLIQVGRLNNADKR